LLQRWRLVLFLRSVVVVANYRPFLYLMITSPMCLKRRSVFSITAVVLNHVRVLEVKTSGPLACGYKCKKCLDWR
jgi:hypothetical protein